MATVARETTVATDTARSVTDLTSRYVEDNVQLWSQYAEGLRRVSEGVLSRPASGRPGGTGSPDFAERARDLVHLSVTHYSKLITTYADFASRFVTTVLEPASRSAPPAGRMPEPSGTGGARPPLANVELTFTGAPGETASQSLVVSNRRAAAVDVAFELTEFVSEDGNSRFRAPVQFVPDRFVLAPETERVVECRIEIGPPFLPGTRYMALLRIGGFPEIRTALVVAPLGTPRTEGLVVARRPGRGKTARRTASRKRKNPR